MKGRRSWFRLVALCGTASFLVGLAMGVFVSSGTVVLAVRDSTPPVADDVDKTAASELATQQGSSASGETFAGLITDDHCGARHDMGSNKNPAECARDCVRDGARYALVNGDKSYSLEGNTQELSRRSGQRVTLTGSLEGNTIQVRSIAAE